MKATVAITLTCEWPGCDATIAVDAPLRPVVGGDSMISLVVEQGTFTKRARGNGWWARGDHWFCGLHYHDDNTEPTKAWTYYFHVSEAASRTGVRAMYIAFALQLHPDRNRIGEGNAERMAELNVAWAQAEAWFDWRDALLGVEKDGR
jgi:hypothetical protein